MANGVAARSESLTLEMPAINALYDHEALVIFVLFVAMLVLRAAGVGMAGN